MAVQMKADDEIRVKILDALRKPHSIEPNISRIQKMTGLHQATIKSSLKFLEKKGCILGFIPNISPKGLGIRLVAIMLLNVNLNDKKTYNRFVKNHRLKSVA